MKKIRCLGDYIDGKTNVCYFIHRGDWGDDELIKHQERHDEELWQGYEEIKVA